MYTIKVNNDFADISYRVSVDDIEAIAKNMGITLNADQKQDVLTTFCADIIQDPDSIISTEHIECVINDVIKI